MFYSQCIACLGADPPIYINPGDTFDMTTDGASFFFCAFHPESILYPFNGYVFEWNASPFISDTSICCPAFFPETTTVFSYTITNPLTGCYCENFLQINVNPSSIEEKSEQNISIYPIPITTATSVFLNDANFKKATFTVYDIRGSMLFSVSSDISEIPFGSLIKSDGLFFYELSVDENLIKRGRIIKYSY